MAGYDDEIVSAFLRNELAAKRYFPDGDGLFSMECPEQVGINIA